MITYYAACSLDHFLAGPNGELDWLPQDPDEDFGYKAFYEQQDLMLMGRKTYDICLSFGTWPYPDKETVVLTRQGGLRPKYNERFEAFDAEVWRRRSKTKKIYLNGGGETARLFLQHGLLDRLEIAVIPSLLGQGLPLFAPGFPASTWKMEKAQGHPTGVLLCAYSKA